MPYTIECVLECANHLGEGPVWDVEEARLYWVDGTGRRVGKPSLWRLDPASGKVEHWALDRDVGALALTATPDRAVMALDDGFYFFDYRSGRLDLITLVDADQPRTRLNDGKVDRRGRFFAGGMDDKEELKVCGLWRLDPDLSVTKVDDGIICSNGPCWSPDDKTFYFADTFQEEIWAYDYDVETGTPSRRRLFASTAQDQGVADGSTVDAEGCVWNAQLISGDLVRYAPDGSVERRITMPVKNITSVVFGGPKLDEIYVTSMARVKHPAVHDLFTVEAKPQFGAGHLFRIRGLGIQGVPEPRFAGLRGTLMELYGRRNSSNVVPVLWTLAELGLPFRRHDIGGSFGPVDPALNPNRQIPVLDDDGFVLWESQAIIRYLVDRHGAGTLRAADPRDRARADQWMEWYKATFYPAFIPLYQSFIRVEPEARDPDRIASLAAAVGELLLIPDAALQDRPFLGGDRFGMGDIPLGAILYRYGLLPVSRPARPALERWLARLAERPAYRAEVMRPFGLTPAEFRALEREGAGM